MKKKTFDLPEGFTLEPEEKEVKEPRNYMCIVAYIVASYFILHMLIKLV